MRYDEPIPPEWGRTTFLRVANRDLALHRTWAAASGAETLAALEAAVVSRAR